MPRWLKYTLISVGAMVLLVVLFFAFLWWGYVSGYIMD
jgi:hypothetical protein